MPAAAAAAKQPGFHYQYHGPQPCLGLPQARWQLPLLDPLHAFTEGLVRWALQGGVSRAGAVPGVFVRRQAGPCLTSTWHLVRATWCA